MSQPAFQIQGLLEKLNNPDADFRFMSLNDLHGHLTGANAILQSDPNLSVRVVDGVIKALDDSNGEVQHLAVKCLGPLVLKVKENQISPILERLGQLVLVAEDKSIPCTALRAVVSNLPRAGAPSPAGSQNFSPQTAAAQQNAAIQAVTRTLLPKLLLMLSQDSLTIDSIDVLIEVLRQFGGQISPQDVEHLQVKVMGVLEHDRATNIVKKRAVTALALLCLYSPDILLSSFVSHLIELFRIEGTSPQRIRLHISVTGALARTIPERFGLYLQTLAPFILGHVDGKDIEDMEAGDEPDMERDEIKEAALVALEAFQSMCPSQMKRFTQETLTAGTRFLKYDPNYADNDDSDDEDMDEDGDSDNEGFDEEDFEEDGNFSDEDDISWKVRRCAAKLLSTLIRTRAADLLEDGTLYGQVAPILVDRFSEREENVRLEVLATATVLVRKTGEIAAAATPTAVPASLSKKRRRELSDVSAIESMLEERTPTPVPSIGPSNSLAQLVPRLAKALSKLMKAKTTSLATKQASITLLYTIVDVLHGGLQNVLGLFMDQIIEAAKGGSAFLSGASQSTGATGLAGVSGPGSATSATGSSLRIEVLKFVGKTCSEHPPAVVEPYLKTLVPAVVAAVRDRFYKICSQAILTCVDIITLLTSGGKPNGGSYLSAIYEAILEKISDSETDLEVRERAIFSMGILLSRTSGSGNQISAQQRVGGLSLLLARLHNETTRITAARAIDLVAKSAKASNDLSSEWVSEVVMELGAQLRKANRSLRGASLDGLKSLISNEVTRKQLGPKARTELVGVLTPLLTLNDLHLLGPTLVIMRLLIETKGVQVTKPIVEAVCALVKTHQGTGSSLENIVALVNTIGRSDQAGRVALMNGLLKDVGVLGETLVVAKVIGNLLVSGGGREGGLSVGVEDFVHEINTAVDDHRRCLALMVLGEAGKQMGPSFPIGPEVFLSQFAAKSEDVPIAAAVALGLAASGSIEKYLPVIMQRLQGDKSKDQYLLLHSLKEIIQHSSRAPETIKPFAKQMWSSLFSITKHDDSKAVGAECVGRLTIIDPYSFLPELQKHLTSPDPTVRGMVISAIRYTFTDTLASYDDLLRPIVVNFLTVMVEDKEFENRRLALTALNSAAHNKPHLIMPHLEKLLPLVYRETVIRPELVREVQMGPFKHKVDDGLEVRKSAYETLYALLETSFSGIHLVDFFTRVIAGLEDEHDIRVLCNLMLSKLAVLAKDEMVARVDDISERFKMTLAVKLKDNAVKQELEKHAELVRSTIRASLVIEKECRSLLGSGESGRGKKWLAYWEAVKVGFPGEVKGFEMEEAAVGGKGY